MNPSFYSWGLPVGRLFGISIKLHWMLLVFWLFRFDSVLGAGADKSHEMAKWLIYVGLTFFIILLHEFGHCFAARSVGGTAREIVLWPLGGLALVDAPETPRAQFVTTAGGPLVNVLIALIAFPLFYYLESSHPGWLRSHYYVASVMYVLTDFNLFLLILNSIPLYPLDGGRIFHSALWWYFEWKGGHGMGPYYRASIITIWTSRVTGVMAGLFAIYAGWFFMLFIVAWTWMDTENLKRHIQHGVGPANQFGHDFSRGYTSLERGGRGAKKDRKPGLFARWKQKQRQRSDMMSQEDESRLDYILQKISREGMGALSRPERKFLDKMSRRKNQD